MLLTRCCACDGLIQSYYPLFFTLVYIFLLSMYKFWILCLLTQGHTLAARQRESETLAHPLGKELELTNPDSPSLLVLLSLNSEKIIECFYTPYLETGSVKPL